MIDTTVFEHEKKLGEALKRLRANPDFVLLINEEYLRNHPAKLAQSLGADNTQNPTEQNKIMRLIEGVGSFSNFLNITEINGITALANLEAIDAGEFSDEDE